MGINSTVAKIPFIILYLVLAALTSANWIRVILFQKSFTAYQSLQPWDYYPSKFFAETFGTSQREYFIFAFPIILLLLFFVPKLLGKLLNMDKTSNIKGDNHIALILILLVLPSVLGFHNYLVFSLILICLFSLISWLDEKKFKTR